VRQNGKLKTVGFVGLGNMGVPMARNLAAAGFALVVRDLDPTRQQLVASELGCAAAEGPDAFEPADAVITMLPTSREVREVTLEWGLAAALRPGTVVIDMSSSSPTVTRELGPLLAERGVALVDAPVSGGVPRAETGTLTIMIGGDDEAAIERVGPVLEALGERLFRAGPLGSGHATKALNNYVAAACYTAAAEAVLVGARFGLDPARLVEVLNTSTGRSFQTETNFPSNVLERKFASGFALGLLAKDVGIAAGLAEEIGIDAPLCQLTSRLWLEAQEGEGAAADHTAAIRHWEKLNGLELPVSPPRDA
jgi:3-hydroxyisobutyrate dehydrogenase